MKLVKNLFFALIVFLLVAAAVIYFFLQTLAPEYRGTLHCPNLNQSVEIERNRSGVPFIRATSLSDLYFAIGFVHAQDRLFQLDLMRRQSRGKLAEIFGNNALETDIEQRQLLLPEAISQTVALIPEKIKKLLSSYSAGINYFISTQRLSPEFVILGYEPELWTIEDSVFIFKNLEFLLAESGNELLNWQLLRYLKKDQIEKILGRVNPPVIAPAEQFHSLTLLRQLSNELTRSEFNLGSNNWAVSGKLSRSQKPLLASDPHLPHNFISSFYQVHASTPEDELSGMTIPGTPFIIIGRNKNLAWAFTNLGTDVIDYYLLTINPANQKNYLWNGQWKEFREEEEEIAIRSSTPYRLVRQRTEFGPVIEENGQLIAVQAIWNFPLRTIESFYRINRARNLNEFLQAAKLFESPAQNIIVADNAGDIAYWPGGLIPKRIGRNGLFPVNANSDRDIWNGFLSEQVKSVLINPPRGFIVTANNAPYDQEKALLFNGYWPPPFRANRIEELLAAQNEKMNVETMRTIQNDIFLDKARFLLDLITDYHPANSRTAKLLEIIHNWNFQVNAGTAPLAFYLLEKNLTKEIFGQLIPTNQELIDKIPVSFLYKILDYPRLKPANLKAKIFDSEQTPLQEDFFFHLENALNNTVSELNKMPTTDWQKLHQISYDHPLGKIKILKPFFSRGPYPMRGGRDTIHVSSFNYKDFKVNYCSSFRMIIDLGQRHESLIVLSSGQSGNPLSRFFADQIPLYLSGGYRPMEKKDFIYQLRLLPIKNKSSD